MTEERADRWTVVLAAVAVEGGLLAAAGLLAWLLAVPAFDRVRFTLAGLAWGLAATLPMFATFALLVRWPVGPFAGIKRFADGVIRPAMRPCSVVDLAGISILAGLGEEMFFRGVLQGAFHGWFGGVWPAVILAAVLFGLMHAITLSYAALATLMGVYLGLVWDATDNLLVPIVAHAAYDFGALLYLTRGPGSDAALVEGGDDGEPPGPADQ